MGHTLKADRGLIYQQQGDGGWHVVASCLAYSLGMRKEAYELAQLMAAAPSITERLVAMTPGGSEFHDDPNRCLNYIERRMARVIEQVRKRKEVEEQRDELLEAAEAALAHITGDGWDGTEGQDKDNPLPKQLRAAIEKARGA